MEDNNTEKPTITVGLEIPLRLDFFAGSTDFQRKQATIEYLGIKASTLFRLIKYLGNEASNYGIHVVDLADYLITIAELGAGLLECQEIIETRFLRDNPQISSQPENFSIYVSQLINRDDLPQDVEDVLRLWCAKHQGGKDDA